MLRSFLRPAGSVRGVDVRGEGRRPAEEDVRSVRAAADAIEADDEAVREWYGNYRVRQLERLSFDLGLVRKFAPAGGRVVDLGACPPVLSGAAASLGYSVAGVDIAPERFGAAFRQLGIEPVTCDLEREPIPLETASVDLAVLHEVFEHLRVNPIHVLREAARILKPGGRLLVSTPNLMSLSGVLNLVLRGRAEGVGTDPWKEFGKLESIGHMGHVREYTTVEVCEFLPHFGLTPELLLFRGQSRGIKRPFTRFVPPLRPFFEVVAVKG
jgi:2-polyprenyl-3-methyl-5-hydroxy-6-metoxy-1,4-benzoquinol methylase